MENRKKFYHKLDWGWRGIKLSIGAKTILTFFLVLIIPITGNYFAITKTIKSFFTKEYIDQIGNQIRSVYEIFEEELSSTEDILKFLTTDKEFYENITKNETVLIEKLKSIANYTTGTTIVFLHEINSSKTITSNGRQISLNKLFAKSFEKISNSDTLIKSYELIPFDKNIFTTTELSIIGSINDNSIVVSFLAIPFNIEKRKYILGSFTILNNNSYLMDKLYNDFSYNTALFSAISFKEKVVATNSTTKNIFFSNLQLPNEIIEELKNHQIVKGIYNIDYQPTAISVIPLKTVNGEIVGGLSIAKDLKGLDAIISQFTAITTAVIFFSSLGIIFLGAVIYNDTKRPIAGIKKAMEEISENNLDVHLDYRTFDDFEDIAKYFNRMVENLKNYTTTLNRFNQLNQVITTTLDVDEVLRISTDKILEYTHSQIAVVYLYNKEEDLLKPYYAKNAKSESLKDISIGEGIVGEVARSRTYFCISDINPENLLIDAGINVIMPKEIAAFPIALKESLIGVMVIGSTIPHKTEELDLINNLLTQVAIVLDNCLTHSHISDLSIKDELTKVYNRRFLIQTLEIEISKAKRSKSPLSIGIFDIDNFKRINDTYGHPVGDTVLKKFAEIIQSHKRNYDIFGRFGGEEFLIILPGTSEGELYNILERFRISIEEQLIGYVNFRVTCSIGGASITDYDKCNLDDMILKADKNLYAAKGSGKNKVIV